MNADREHLDAETIAAWMDGGLDDASMAAAEAHASTCERCQEILAAVAKTTPVVVVEKRPFRIPAWWYPIAAGAAAALVWMVVPEQQKIATAPPQPPAAVEEKREASPPPAAAASKENANAAAPRDAFAERKDQTPAAPAPKRLQDADTNKLKKDDKLETARARNEIAADAQAGVAQAPGAPAAPIAPSALQKTARLADAEVASPDGSKRWRFANYGANITGGAAVSSSVCWLIGKGGIVMLTTNGTDFQHVDLPERVDIASIAATDARTASVVTVDGRRFQTTDGGRSWRLIPA